MKPCTIVSVKKLSWVNMDNEPRTIYTVDHYGATRYYTWTDKLPRTVSAFMAGRTPHTTQTEVHFKSGGIYSATSETYYNDAVEALIAARKN